MFISRLSNRFYGIHFSIFSTLDVSFSLSKLPLPRYGRKRSFAGFQTSFMAFDVLFLALWSLVLVDRRYCCQDTGRNFHLPSFKTVLRHLLFYILYFGGFFELIECTVSKIPAKTFIFGILNWLYSIRSSIFLALWKTF